MSDALNPVVSGATAPVTVACPPCNCPACAACPKCPDCGATVSPTALVDDQSFGGISNIVWLVILVATMYYFLFYTGMGRELYNRYIG